MSRPTPFTRRNVLAGLGCTALAAPMLGRAESVNLAVAAGVFLYAAERAQR